MPVQAIAGEAKATRVKKSLIDNYQSQWFLVAFGEEVLNND
jgi:hypothetical protein